MEKQPKLTIITKWSSGQLSLTKTTSYTVADAIVKDTREFKAVSQVIGARRKAK
jgi:hypothetical protein